MVPKGRMYKFYTQHSEDEIILLVNILSSYIIYCKQTLREN